MTPRPSSILLLIPFTLLISGMAGAAGEPQDAELQIAGALAAAPAEYRDTAAVLGYVDGQLVTLREGEGELVCLADKPGDETFHVACYHKTLEPFMARGRELKTQGVAGGGERLKIRHEEVDAGTLRLPKEPTALYSVTSAADSFDPETGKVAKANRVYVVYMPYATQKSTGFPSEPNSEQPSLPWIMRAGTPSAHLMITPGPEEDSEN